MGVLPPLEPRFQAILEEREAEHRRVLVEHDRHQERAHELASFTGPASFGLVLQVAAELEAAGKVVYAHWRRDERGVITGLAICEAAPVNGRGNF
jgi:hypothetical protein